MRRTSHSLGWLLFKKKKKGKSVGEDVEKPEPLDTAGGHVK